MLESFTTTRLVNPFYYCNKNMKQSGENGEVIYWLLAVFDKVRATRAKLNTDFKNTSRHKPRFHMWVSPWFKGFRYVFFSYEGWREKYLISIGESKSFKNFIYHRFFFFNMNEFNFYIYFYSDWLSLYFLDSKISFLATCSDKTK